MNSVYKALQQQVQPRMLLILLVSLVLMSVLSAYLYVLKQPLQNLSKAQQTLSSLLDESIDSNSLTSDIETQTQLNQTLSQQLLGTSPQLPLNQMVAFVIGELDRVAEKHALHLGSVRPQETQRILTFNALNFDVEISGRYTDLYQWLTDVEQVLGPMVINRFTIETANTPSGESSSRTVKMLLTLTNYQFQEAP